jgi:hypothetical protein
MQYLGTGTRLLVRVVQYGDESTSTGYWLALVLVLRNTSSTSKKVLAAVSQLVGSLRSKLSKARARAKTPKSKSNSKRYRFSVFLIFFPFPFACSCSCSLLL